LSNTARIVSMFLVLTQSGCCTSPWNVFPMNRPPDIQFTTGSATHGEDVYIWECQKGEPHRSVVHQYSGEMFCAAPGKEESACGTLTSFESSLGAAPRMAPRPGYSWPGSAR
jgi:hypothetical protein